MSIKAKPFLTCKACIKKGLAPIGIRLSRSAYLRTALRLRGEEAIVGTDVDTDRVALPQLLR